MWYHEWEIEGNNTNNNTAEKDDVGDDDPRVVVKVVDDDAHDEEDQSSQLEKNDDVVESEGETKNWNNIAANAREEFRERGGKRIEVVERRGGRQSV